MLRHAVQIRVAGPREKLGVLCHRARGGAGVRARAGPLMDWPLDGLGQPGRLGRHTHRRMGEAKGHVGCERRRLPLGSQHLRRGNRPAHRRKTAHRIDGGIDQARRAVRRRGGDRARFKTTPLVAQGELDA